MCGVALTELSNGHTVFALTVHAKAEALDELILFQGLMKDEEIYTIFDTKKILNKPATVQISKTSGLAGVAYWINQTYCLEDGEKLDKKSPLVVAMKEWVDRQYEDGRQTVMTERELKEKIRQLAPDFAERG